MSLIAQGSLSRRGGGGRRNQGRSVRGCCRANSRKAFLSRRFISHKSPPRDRAGRRHRFLARPPAIFSWRAVVLVSGPPAGLARRGADFCFKKKISLFVQGVRLRGGKKRGEREKKKQAGKKKTPQGLTKNSVAQSFPRGSRAGGAPTKGAARNTQGGGRGTRTQ